MIKNGFKRFLGIGLFVLFGCLFSVNFSSAVRYEINETITLNYNNNGYNNLPSSSELYIDNLGNITSNVNGILLEYKNSPYWIVKIFRNEGKLAQMFTTWNYNNTEKPRFNQGIQGYFNQIIQYDYTANKTNIDNANLPAGGEYIDFVDLQNTISAYSFRNNDETTPQKLGFCFISDTEDKAYCINTYANADLANQDSNFSGYVFSPFNNNINDKIGVIVNYTGLGLSPIEGGGGDSGGGSLVPVFSDVDNAISYFENTKGYNESMCYVGTFNLTGIYGTPGVSFQEGTGDTIFQLYNSLYSGFGSNLVINVGNFIDVWTLNYFQWFYNSNEEYGVRRLATYNGPDTLYDIYYENLTFPFTDNPVAIFFMASNLYDGYDNIYNYGSYVSSYCYMKLNYDNIKSGDIDYVEDVVPLLPSAIDNNIKDYVKYDFNYGNTGYYYSPEWIGSWTGDYELSGNLELDGVFTNFLDNFNSKLGNIDFGYTFGIIPDWILYPLIFLILFRIMKH